MGKKGKKAQAGKPKKLSPKDIGKRLDALVKKLEKELEGADLFAPLPPAEDCPICCTPLSHMLNRSVYKPCCGKAVCGGCHAEHTLVSENNGGGLGLCPFCRAPELGGLDFVRQLDARFSSHNDKDASLVLGYSYSAGKHVPKDLMKAMSYFITAAELGSAQACSNIGLHYNDGISISKDTEKAAFFYRAGAFRGCISSRDDIGSHEYEERNVETAIRHWKISAEAGNQQSLDRLKTIFNGNLVGKDFISKEYMDNVYRACHEAQKNVKSESREKLGLVATHTKEEKEMLDAAKC